MNTYDFQDLEGLKGLVRVAHESDHPVVVSDAGDECLVAMRPAVFERIVLEGEALNALPRVSLHF